MALTRHSYNVGIAGVELVTFAHMAQRLTASDLKPRIKQVHIDITKVDGGCWVYGPRWKLERTLAVWSVR